MKAWLEHHFHLKRRGTTVEREFMAGLTTFVTMLYIVPVNAAIMTQAGMPFEALVTATALVTVFASVLNGLWSNTPIAMSVGMGLNAYFTFGLVKGLGIPWETALGVVFLSGALFMLLSFTPLRRWLVDSIPDDIRKAVTAGIGAFIAFIGLKQMGIIVAHPATLVGIGHLGDGQVLLGLFGLALTAVLMARGAKGAFMISITVTALLGWVCGLANVPEHLFSLPASIAPIALKLDLAGACTLVMLPVIVTFLVTSLFDAVGTISGVASRAGMFTGKGSKELKKTLEADAVCAAGSSLLGVSTTTAFVESATGVEEGGRTGLTAVFTGLLFLMPLFLLPVFQAVPPNAIYPVLVAVGGLMFSEIKHINLETPSAALPAFLIVLLMPLTFSITYGLAAGILAAIVMMLAQGRWREINPALLLLGAISLVPFLLRH
ncbi:MAG: NCS2 family permease [Alphaproteobacteria bacterium]|nr:NCS2 family permease [Alphaproteobacteria bacterium]